MEKKGPSLKAIYDALTGSSSDSCDPDWCADVLDKASPKDVARIREEFVRGGTEAEVARRLGIWPY